MAKKPRLRNQLNPNVKWLLNESDAGCITLGCSVLDHALKSLHARLIALNSVDETGKGASQELLDRLLTNNGPLAHFSARTKLAFAYGLIDRAEFQCIE